MRINPVVLALLLVLPAFVSSDLLAQELDLKLATPHTPCSSCLLPHVPDARSPLAPTRSALFGLPSDAGSPATDAGRFQELVEPDALCHKNPAKFIVTAGVLVGSLIYVTFGFSGGALDLDLSAGERLKWAGLGVAGGAVMATIYCGSVGALGGLE